MKPVEIILSRGWGTKRENDGGVHLRSIVSTYINIKMYPPVQILYANKIIKNSKSCTNLKLDAWVMFELSPCHSGSPWLTNRIISTFCQDELWTHLILFIYSLSSAGNGTQGLNHARQIVYCWAKPQPHDPFYFILFLGRTGFWTLPLEPHLLFALVYYFFQAGSSAFLPGLASDHNLPV
jgi:hypothetical protein